MRCAMKVVGRAGRVLLLALLLASPLAAQGRGRGVAITDTARARDLYVSRRPEDHPVANYEQDAEQKLRTDSIFAARAKGVVDFQKIKYRSKVGDLDIPAYLFQPLQKRGAKGHPGLIMVHGGVHGNMTESYWPFIREAVQRGYVVITPNYRGSTGYGKAFHNAIDYGGHEVDDVMTAYDYMTRALAHVDPA